MVWWQGKASTAFGVVLTTALVLSCGEEDSSGPEQASSSTFYVTGTLGGVERYAEHNINPPVAGVSALNATTEPDVSSPQWYFFIEFPTDPPPTTFACANMGYFISFLDRPDQYSGRATGICEFSFEAGDPDAWQGTFTATLLDTSSSQNIELTDGRFRLPRAAK